MVIMNIHDGTDEDVIVLPVWNRASTLFCPNSRPKDGASTVDWLSKETVERWSSDGYVETGVGAAERSIGVRRKRS